MSPETKFTEEKRARYLGSLRQGLRHGQACRAANISRQTVWQYKKAHPEFQQEIDHAEADYCDEVEKCLLKSIRKLNLSAMIFWLTNRAPDRWRDRRGQPTIIQQADDPVLADILKRLKEKGGS